MMLSEVTRIGCGEVHLIVVGACHGAVEHIAVGPFESHEVAIGEIVEALFIARCWCIEVLTATIALVHLIECEVRTILVVLRVVDTLRVRELQFQSFEDVAPSEVVGDASVDVHVVAHRTAVVAIVLQHREVVVLVLVHLRVADSIGSHRHAVDIFGNISWVSEQQVIVFLIARTAHFHEWCILFAIVAADGQIGTEPLADLHVDAGAIVPAVVVEASEVTVLCEVRNTSKVTDTLRGTADIGRMLLRESCLPVVAQQIIIEILHSLELILLKECGGLVERSVGGVGGSHCIVETTIVIGAQHFGASHLIGKTEGSAIADGWFANLTLFGGHEYYTIGSTCTINGGRSVFQYRDALHFRGIEVIECLSTEVLGAVANLDIVGIYITIDNEERLLCADAHGTE